MVLQLVGKRLLVVNDQAADPSTLTALVESWGIRLHTVASGADALALLRHGEAFDAAILNVEADGLTLADQIRRQPAGRGLPLILLTPDHQRPETSSSGAVELAAWLVTPVRPSQLYDTLMTICDSMTASVSAPQRPRIDYQMAAWLPLQILVAEDNPVNQKVAVYLLAQMGYRADMAANGLEVLQAVQRRRYDVVLMDVHMPGMDGFEATRRLQQLPAEQRPRIIAMTASASYGDRARCLAAGMDDHLSKPVQVAELQAVLQRWGHPPTAPHEPEDAAVLPEEEFATLTTLRAMQPRGGHDLVTELVDLFLEDTPSWLTALREALRRSDTRAFAHAAHSLKGSCAMIGAKHMAALCARLEQWAHQGRLQALETSLHGLEAEFQRVRQVLAGKRRRL